MAQALGCKEKACISLAGVGPALLRAPRSRTHRVLHFRRDAPPPQRLQHLGLQPLSPVSRAHHNDLWGKMARAGLRQVCGEAGAGKHLSPPLLQYLFGAPATRRERSFPR